MKLKYFLPDWEDRLDPEFDFTNDKYCEKHIRNPYENDVYAHNLFKEAPYEGILFSLSVFQSKIYLGHDGKNFQIRNHSNIKDYLKITKNLNLEVMGDCGAFGYVQEKDPPEFYNVKNIANLYQELNFDYGVSVDHLVVDYIFVRNKKVGRKEKQVLSKKEKNRRIQITLKNAKDFFELRRKRQFNFAPIGVAQGYDIDTYKNSVKSLIEIGYDYIGIGGLVQYKTEFILEILNGIQHLTNGVKIHLFGISRPKHIEEFMRLGVTSLDSASFFRKAWLRSGQNYLAQSGDWYTAIRVPNSSDPRILREADLNGFSISKVKRMEEKALQVLLKYDKGHVKLEEVLDVVIKYDKLLLRNTDDGEKLGQKYRKTLSEMPWKTCKCDICSNIGINVVIFRGANRNKRRGFHNIAVFHNLLREGSLGKKAPNLCSSS